MLSKVLRKSSLQDLIATDIEKKIIKKVSKSDQLLPSEEEIEKKYNVSRVTVRLALKKLQEKNLIYKKQGIGSFINSKKINQTLTSAKTIIAALREKKLNPKIKIINNFSQENLKNLSYIKKILGLKFNSKIENIRRIVSLNNRPYAVLDTFLDRIFSPIKEILIESKGKKTTYEILENDFGYKIKEAKYIIGIEKPCNSILNLLGLNNNTHCLKETRITYSDNKKILEITIFYYPPNSADFEVVLPRRDSNFLLRIK